MGNLFWERKGNDIAFKGSKGAVKMMQTFPALAASVEQHCLDVDASVALMASGSGFVGGNFVVTANVAAGHGAWLSGIYAKAYSTGATAPVTGYVSGGEFECSLAGAQNPPSHCCIALNMTDVTSGSANGQNAYIYIRQYGTEARANNLFWIADHTIGTNNNAVLISSLNSNKDATHKIKCITGSGNVPLWLLATTTGPAS